MSKCKCIKCGDAMYAIMTHDVRDTCYDCGGKAKMAWKEEKIRDAMMRYGLLSWYNRNAPGKAA